MKTVTQIQSEIDIILSDLKMIKERGNAEYYRKETKKNKKRLEFLNMCKMYMETKPRPEFILSEIDRLANKLGKIDSGFNIWFKSCGLNDIKKAKIVYNNELGARKVKDQLQTLRYLYYE